MKLHQLVKITHRRNRVGRGISAGQGKTAGRGTKGQRARTGKGAPVGFEGGQTRLYRRLPKIGGIRSHKTRPITLTLKKINRAYKDGDRIDLKTLSARNLIKVGQIARIVATGNITRKGLRIAGKVLVTKKAKEFIYSVLSI